MAKEEKIKEFFNKRILEQGKESFSSDIKNENLSGKAIQSFLKKKIPLENTKILDAGCGEGRFSKWFIENGANITSMDFSKEYVNICNSNFSKGKFIVGSVTNLPFKDNSFDYIFVIDVLQHVPDLAKAITEFHRVLNKNGKLFIIDKNKFGLNGKYFIPERFLFVIKNIFRKTYGTFRERWFHPNKLEKDIHKKFRKVQHSYIIEKNKSLLFDKFKKLNLLVAWEAWK